MVLAEVNYCRSCLLPVPTDAEVIGETSFLFASLHCQCQKKKSEQGIVLGAPARGGLVKDKSSKERCLRCNKEIVPAEKIGSFTGFLFQEFRCKCAQPVPGRGKTKQISKALQGTLATQFFPHAGNKTRLARLERRAANHTQMVLSGVKSIALQDLHTGESIANSYVLEEQIGLGGMGAVYRARHQMLGRVCALKFLLPSAVSATSWEMFKKEAKILNELQHPAICRIFDMGLHKGCLPFYAMEYLDGITLEELLNRKNTLGLGAALEIFIAVGDALSYAHRHKIIHRDVKPANIMLVHGPNGAVDVKLLDFGIAELSEFGQDKVGLEVVGSSAYMSPEQFTGQSLTAATDIYSLACSLFETLAGDAPFDGATFEELRQQHQDLQAPTLKEFTALDFPADIEAVLEHALRKDPVRRYRYMSEMTVDMQRILDGKPLQFARGGGQSFAGAVSNRHLLGSGNGLDDSELVYGHDGELDEHNGLIKTLGGRRQFLTVASLMVLLLIGVVVYCRFTGTGMAINQSLALKGLAVTSAPAEPKYFRLTQADYEKLDCTQPFDPDFHYYLFPTHGDVRVGQIFLPESFENPALYINASGIVKVRPKLSGKTLGLAMSSGLINELELLRGFHEDELVRVVLPRVGEADVSFERSRNFGTYRPTSQIFHTLKNFKNVRTIDAQTMILDAESVEFLDHFPKLDELMLTDASVNEVSFVKLSCLSRLKILYLPHLVNVTPILKKLSESGLIEELKMRDYSWSEMQIASLMRLKSLKKFGCTYSEIPIKLVEKIATCRNIEALNFGGCSISPEAGAALLRMSWLKQLVLAENLRKSWGDSRYEKFLLEMRRKGCNIVFWGEAEKHAITTSTFPTSSKDLLEKMGRELDAKGPSMPDLIKDFAE